MGQPLNRGWPLVYPMAKHWQNVLAGGDSAMNMAFKAKENRDRYYPFGSPGVYRGHTFLEWLEIAQRRYKRAAEMFNKRNGDPDASRISSGL